MDDLKIARKYCAKAQSSQQRGVSFTLTFIQYKKLLNTKKCFYTGVVLTDPSLGVVPTSFTIDRIDASVGYTNSNCVACSHEFNQIKGNLTLRDIRILSTKLKNKL